MWRVMAAQQQQQRAAFPVCSVLICSQRTSLSFLLNMFCLPAVLLSPCLVSCRLAVSWLLTLFFQLPWGFYCLFLCLPSPVSWLHSHIYPLLSPVSCLPSPVYPLKSSFSRLPSSFSLHLSTLSRPPFPIYTTLSTLSCLSFLPSPVSPFYPLLSLLSSPLSLNPHPFFFLPTTFSFPHLLLNGRVRCRDKCLRLCVVIFYLICNCTSTSLPPLSLLLFLLLFHAKICNFIGLYRFAIAREAKKKKESSVQKNYIAQANSVWRVVGRGGGRGKRMAWKTFAKQKCKYLSYRKHALLLLQFVLESPQKPLPPFLHHPLA